MTNRNKQKKLAKINKKAIGSSFDDYLKKQGDYVLTQFIAIKRVVTWRISKAIKQLKKEN